MCYFSLIIMYDQLPLQNQCKINGAKFDQYNEYQRSIDNNNLFQILNQFQNQNIFKHFLKQTKFMLQQFDLYFDRFYILLISQMYTNNNNNYPQKMIINCEYVCEHCQFKYNKKKKMQDQMQNINFSKTFSKIFLRFFYYQTFRQQDVTDKIRGTNKLKSSHKFFALFTCLDFIQLSPHTNASVNKYNSYKEEICLL
eukprot:TRINITY_DN1851_c0_g1_i1.p1 TRINITY_DN1851_c0_g1~~TRINITY_DN1851_c0_g1_i1.p1  ORF type:complete len:197 (-),score=-7.70 TRINITY_DN1851_c0_g1_i1:1689-2279(-)